MKLKEFDYKKSKSINCVLQNIKSWAQIICILGMFIKHVRDADINHKSMTTRLRGKKMN